MLSSPRIVSNPKILSGKPVIKGTRMSVEFLLELLRSGMTTADILVEYPHLTKGDIQAALLFAKQAVSGHKVYSLGDRVTV